MKATLFIFLILFLIFPSFSSNVFVETLIGTHGYVCGVAGCHKNHPDFHICKNNLNKCEEKHKNWIKTHQHKLNSNCKKQEISMKKKNKKLEQSYREAKNRENSIRKQAKKRILEFQNDLKFQQLKFDSDLKLQNQTHESEIKVQNQKFDSEISKFRNQSKMMKAAHQSEMNSLKTKYQAEMDANKLAHQSELKIAQEKLTMYEETNNKLQANIERLQATLTLGNSGIKLCEQPELRYAMLRTQCSAISCIGGGINYVTTKLRITYDYTSIKLGDGYNYVIEKLEKHVEPLVHQFFDLVIDFFTNSPRRLDEWFSKWSSQKKDFTKFQNLKTSRKVTLHMCPLIQNENFSEFFRREPDLSTKLFLILCLILIIMIEEAQLHFGIPLIGTLSIYGFIFVFSGFFLHFNREMFEPTNKILILEGWVYEVLSPPFLVKWVPISIMGLFGSAIFFLAMELIRYIRNINAFIRWALFFFSLSFLILLFYMIFRYDFGRIQILEDVLTFLQSIEDHFEIFLKQKNLI
jgi:hypothetical protein